MNETLKRSISGAIYILLLIASIQYSIETFFILFGIFLLIAVLEFCNLVHLNKIAPIVIALLFYFFFYKIAIATKIDGILYILRYSKNFDLAVLFLSLFVSLKCIVFLFDNKNLKVDAFSKFIYLIGYIILPFIIITKIPFGIKGYNPNILISIFILIWTNDTFAYLVGKSIGKHKLFERISPKKTIEGFLGGIGFAILASYFISKYFLMLPEKNTFIWITIALIVGIFGTIGDLVESKFKRISEKKDSGNIMPGHGGILDRLDSVIFVAPIVFLFYQILSYVS
ncbi:phosphatidate cytidylyltransferase [Flavobacterium sp. N3904]|uniref:phosphatidate cytidylyltransferase n=1 Tax=Flavobacterium sp. N3904 TaxID=2986835 RepID=UPI0022255756|nr:phosphatidate cytidylyltransferase [Flavobacterium sp. N3904]